MTAYYQLYRRMPEGHLRLLLETPLTAAEVLRNANRYRVNTIEGGGTPYELFFQRVSSPLIAFDAVKPSEDGASGAQALLDAAIAQAEALTA